jgi:ADP-ribose pyrophosphatase
LITDLVAGADGTVRRLCQRGTIGRMTTPWQLVGERPGSPGYLPLTVHHYLLPDGTEADWDIFGSARCVAILAVTEGDEVVLARQYRPGPGKVLDELPGGRVDDGEDVLEAAARELLEETGYAGDIELAGTSWFASACRTQRFVAVVREARQVAPPANEPGEFCEVVLVSLPAFRDHLRSGQLTDVDLGYLALDHLGLLT